MRRSIYDDDKRMFSVTLNGKPIEDVVWADEELGQAGIWEHEWALERRGQRVYDPDCPQMTRLLIVSGAIQITNGEPTQPAAADPYEPWSDFNCC